MTDQELERRLAEAVRRAAPDDLDGVLSRCAPREGKVISMNTKKPRRAIGGLVAACLALLLVGTAGGVLYQQANAVASVISLDVNPSIEMTVSRTERVLTCTPLNDDARTILADMGDGADLKGTKLDVAVNAIVGALVRYGYLDSISSAILISVEDQDADRAAKLQRELTAAVDAVLTEQAAQASVLSQTVTQDAGLEALAQESSISTGKAYLVQQVLAMNGAGESAWAQLSALSVEELRDLLETGETRIPIGRSAAIQAAEEYAGTTAMDSVVAEVDPELDESPAHYEVELKTAWGEYDYRIDAFTGAVLSGQADVLAQAPTGGAATSQIEAAQAKAAALAHAGVSESQTRYCNVWLEYDDGRPEHYQVEFAVGTVQYEYEISLTTAAVLQWEREDYAPAVTAAPTQTPAVTQAPAQTQAPTVTQAPATAGDIGASQAKAVALAHAGLTEGQVTQLKVEQDYDHGRLEYEIEFKSGGMEYEYTIDGGTGAILEHEQDWDD